MNQLTVLNVLFILVVLDPAHASRVSIQAILSANSHAEEHGPVTVDWLKANRGHESEACSKNDLLDSAVNTFFSLFILGSQGNCQEWVDAFVPDELELPTMWHFQWQRNIVGRSSLLAFCNFANKKAMKASADPTRLLTRASDTYFMASGTECRTITQFQPDGDGLRQGAGGYQLIFMTPLDADNQPTLKMCDVVKYGIKSYTEVAWDETHTIPLEGLSAVTAGLDMSMTVKAGVQSASVDWFGANYGKESVACGRTELMNEAVNTFFSMFLMGSEGKCEEWADAFVPDELGPASIWNPQWLQPFAGQDNVLAFCQFAHSLQVDFKLDPTKILRRASDAYFVASGQECRAVCPYSGLKKGAGGFQLVFMTPLDADNQVTLNMQDVVRYGIKSFTEIASDEEHTVARPAEGSAPAKP